MLAGTAIEQPGRGVGWERKKNLQALLREGVYRQETLHCLGYFLCVICRLSEGSFQSRVWGIDIY